MNGTQQPGAAPSRVSVSLNGSAPDKTPVTAISWEMLAMGAVNCNRRTYGMLARKH
jgi:hypothetical protein